MYWNPEQGQDPNQPTHDGVYNPPQPAGLYDQQGVYPQGDYIGQQGINQDGYQQEGYQQSGYGQQQASYQQSGYWQQQANYYQQPYGAPPIGRVSPLGSSSLGMDPNVSAGLGYLAAIVSGVGIIVAILLFALEKQNRFVRFHTLQSLFFQLSFFVLYIAFFVFFFLGSIFTASTHGDILFALFPCGIGLFVITWFVGWLVAMISAFQSKYVKLPVIGNLAEKYAYRGMPGTSVKY